MSDVAAFFLIRKVWQSAISVETIFVVKIVFDVSIRQIFAERSEKWLSAKCCAAIKALSAHHIVCVVNAYSNHLAEPFF